MGMVGGGAGSFIGPVHRMAAELDGTIELVAGAFSQDAARSRQAGVTYGISPDRAYSEFRRDDGAGEQAGRCHRLCLHRYSESSPSAHRSGCPGAWLPCDERQAGDGHPGRGQTLAEIIRRTGLLYGLTFTYTGYPLVREARLMARGGELGKIRKAVVQYSQGWLSTSLETTGHKQAAWRSDPARSGLGGAIGDIGVHAFNLLEYVSGREVAEICADLNRVGSRPLAGRRLQRTAQARQRSPRRSVCIPDRSRRSQRPAASSLWRKGRTPLVAGKSQLPARELDRAAESNPARSRGLSGALGAGRLSLAHGPSRGLAGSIC